MKRSVPFLIMILLISLMISSALAEFSRESWFSMGLSALEDGTPEAVEMAVDYFDAAGNYDQAKNYKQYSLYLEDIFALDSEEEVDINNTIAGLFRLSGKEDFEASLQEHGFYACQLLIDYIAARQLQNEGQLAKAWHAYYVIDDVLDSADRLYVLTAQVYQIGKASMEDGRYLDAIEALRNLYYADSETLLARAEELIQPAPTPIPTPSPTPSLEDKTITLSVETASGYNALTWNLVDGAENYEILRHQTGKQYKAVSSVTEGNTYDDSNVYSGYRYYYTVIAHFSGGRTIASNEEIVIAQKASGQSTPPNGTKVITIYCYSGGKIIDIRYQQCYVGSNWIKSPSIDGYLADGALIGKPKTVEVILSENGTLTPESVSFNYVNLSIGFSVMPVITESPD